MASRAKLMNQQFVSGHPAGSQAYPDPLSMRMWAGQYCFGGFEGFWHGEFGRGRHLERLASLKNLLHVFRFQTLLSSTDTLLARFDCCTTSQDEIIVERPVSCCNFWQGLTLSLWLEKRTWRSDEDRMEIGWNCHFFSTSWWFCQALHALQSIGSTLEGRLAFRQGLQECDSMVGKYFLQMWHVRFARQLAEMFL